MNPLLLKLRTWWETVRSLWYINMHLTRKGSDSFKSHVQVSVFLWSFHIMNNSFLNLHTLCVLHSTKSRGRKHALGLHQRPLWHHEWLISRGEKRKRKKGRRGGGVLDPANKCNFQHQTHSQSCQSVPVPIFSDGQNFSQRCTNRRRSSTNQEVFTNDSCFTACVCIIIETQHHKALLPCYYFLLWLFSFAHLLTSCSVMIWTL